MNYHERMRAAYPEGTTVWAVSVCLFPYTRKMTYEEIEGGTWDEVWAVEAPTPEQALTVANMIASGMERARHPNAFLDPPHMVMHADRQVQHVPDTP